jgi:hypothetical protein
MPGGVLAERAHRAGRQAGGVIIARVAGAQSHRVDLGLAEVAVDTSAAQGRDRVVTNDVTADDGAVVLVDLLPAVLADVSGRPCSSPPEFTTLVMSRNGRASG